jgi:hypothetical protein
MIETQKFAAVFNSANTMLAAVFLAGGSRQEKASVRLPCFGKKLAANVRWFI